jgi:hypothetical protein
MAAVPSGHAKSESKVTYPVRLSTISAVLAVGLLLACRSNRQGNVQNDERGQAKFVILDLRFTAPLGYEFCAGESTYGDSRAPQKLPHKDLNPTIRLPKRLELPPEAFPAQGDRLRRRAA